MLLKKSLIVLALVTTSSFAVDDEDPCNVEGGGVTAGYLCVEEKMKLANIDLNKTYQEAIMRIAEEEAELQKIEFQIDLEEPFRRAQQAWLKYRDADCEFIGQAYTPSPWAGVQIEECKLRMILERIEYFKGTYSVPD
ncbi:lysozyme inhibitor LprI family protein [Vibrio sp. SNU_ST1]|uniref:lysozyme inhibitor LprI family protein n=1 Tax=Vibrio sp. SNU_ST1 TaxID=3064001 RepID=UPI00272A94CA|nr:lysozyme inhibitor LprI family protein [Vibrio sp. SNU_ST1]WKY60522.1 lysozyme inhibitor LprI family protein [Vibrio sp. SNU_ST1]